MSGSIIMVKVQVERYPGPGDIEVAKELDEFIVEEAFIPLDMPDTGASGFDSALFCSPPVTIQKVLRNRRWIAEALTRAIMEALASRDTKMGY